jgi:hypothetical protein
MTERAITFGPRSELVGVLTEPAPERAASPLPAVLLWNVGVNHHVGPFRIYVELARRLAEEGFVVLRFDASGLGDSEVRRDGVADRERAPLDVKDAMDAVSRRTGTATFVLVGFCSSVDAAHTVAVRDPRVVGVVHLEGYAYRTRGFFARYPLRLLSRERWRRYLRAKLGRLGGPEPEPMHREEIYQRDYPDWTKFTRELELLADRGARLLFTYVGGDTDFNHVGQFWEMFPVRRNRGAIDVVYYPDTDHTFYSPEARARVIERICAWARSSFRSAPARGA